MSYYFVTNKNHSLRALIGDKEDVLVKYLY